MHTFVQRFTHAIHGILSGFDRVRFRGTQRLLASLRGMRRFLQFHGILLKEFDAFAHAATQGIKRAVEQQAADLGRPVLYLNNAHTRKEDVARQLARQHGVREGLIGILSAVEPCWSFEVGPNRAAQKRELRVRPKKCLHYYHYWLDPEVGFCHVRLQTWLPYHVFVCINGREMLAQQLDQAGVAYVRRDNCFTAVADLEQAQALADAQVRWDWSALLQRLLAASHPAWRTWPGMERDYYWSAEETEWASDVLFRSAAALTRWMPAFVRHGLEVLHSADVLRFLGQRVPAHGGVHGRFAGEIATDLKRRPEGVRVLHRVNANKVKLYDKQGSVLRVETVINNPRALKSYRTAEGDPDGPKAWRPLRKGVADLPRRAALSQKSNERYLEALATVEEPRTLGELTARVSRRTRWKGRSVRALHLLGADDSALLRAVGHGGDVVNGFANRDLRQRLYGAAAGDAAEAKRRSAAVTRKIRLLRAHGVVGKVGKTRRYRVTPFGQALLTAVVSAQAARLAQLQAAA
jgi:hypothetical protein